MSCRIILRKEDSQFGNVEVTFNGGSTVEDWVDHFRSFMLACAFHIDTVNNVLPKEE